MKNSQTFQKSLEEGFFDDLDLRVNQNIIDSNELKVSYNFTADNEECHVSKDVNLTEGPYHGFDPDKLTLFLHQIPKTLSRWAILDVVKTLPGFVSLSMSEPIKNQNFVRYCWVSFDTEENCDKAFHLLNEKNELKLNPIKSKSTTLKKIKVTPPMLEERLNIDLELSEVIIKLQDKIKGIEVFLIF